MPLPKPETKATRQDDHSGRLPGNDCPASSLGQLIRGARERKGWSRAKLSELSGISYNSMVKYELAGADGGQYPSLRNMAQLCQLLEIDPRHIFETFVDGNSDPLEPLFSFISFFRDDQDWRRISHDTMVDIVEVLSEDLQHLRRTIREHVPHLAERPTAIRLSKWIEDHLDEIDQENGPDQGPSRSTNPNNPSKDVPASSTNDPKGGADPCDG